MFRYAIWLTAVFAMLTSGTAAGEPEHVSASAIAALMNEHLAMQELLYAHELADAVWASLYVDAYGNLIPADSTCEPAPEPHQRIEIMSTREVTTEGTTLRTEYDIIARVVQLATSDISFEVRQQQAVIEDAEAAEFLGVPDRFALEPLIPILLSELLMHAEVTGFADACGTRIADYSTHQ